MNDDDKLHISFERGQKAKMLMENEAFRDALAHVENGLIELFKNGGDASGRIYAELVGLRSVKRRLEQVISDGSFAQTQINAKRT